MRILIVYDNHAHPPLREGWGFSALVETGDRRLLFDTGADRLLLARNAEALGVDVSGLTDLFLSHLHCDHVGGLSYALEKAKGLTLWAPAGMEAYLRPRTKGTGARLETVKGPRKLGNGLRSTGTMGRTVKEHGLVVSSRRGPVLITGCAHPSVARMAERAIQLADQKLHLVLGGFHLSGATACRLERALAGLEATTHTVAPGHCTGEKEGAMLCARLPSSSPLAVGWAWEDR